MDTYPFRGPYVPIYFTSTPAHSGLIVHVNLYRVFMCSYDEMKRYLQEVLKELKSKRSEAVIRVS